METSEPTAATVRPPAPAQRRDVLTARSRMRTKYGSQRQIEQVAAMLDVDETLLTLAVAGGPERPDHHNHGLLALTDRRLMFVPRTAAHDPVETDLDEVRALLRSRDGRTGSLGVITEAGGPSFTGIANADARDLAVTIVRLRPDVTVLGDH